jgi:hypothetical protein
MHSRLKAAPTITLSAREMLSCSCRRTYLQEVTVVVGVNGRITDKKIVLFLNCADSSPPIHMAFIVYTGSPFKNQEVYTYRSGSRLVRQLQ